MRSLVFVLCLVGCSGKGSPDDCKLVLGDPAHAMEAVTQRYPGQPVKVAEVIERCVAPSGDECERIAKLVGAIPSMMPTVKSPASGDLVASCRGMPPEMRRCTLPSYALAHEDECTKVYERIRATPIEEALRIPAGPRRGGVKPCAPIAIALRPDGLRLATRPDGRCFRARKAGALDVEWLEAELKAANVENCAPAATIAALPDVRYQEAITVIDIAVKVGVLDVELGAMDDLAVELDGDAAGDPAHCPPMVAAAADAKPPTPQPPSRPIAPPTGDLTAEVPLPSPQHTLKRAPVVLVSRTELAVNGKHVATISELANGNGKIDALVASLPAKPTDPTIIVQADQATEMKVMIRVIDTVKSAGYDSVLFAVKNP